MGSHAGAYVVDLGTGAVLYSRNADLALRARLQREAADHLDRADPARAGHDARHRRARRARRRAAARRHAARATWSSSAPVTRRSTTSRCATSWPSCARAGIRRVTGAIVGDESLFDNKRGSYDSDFGYDSDLGGELGALTWGHGRFDSRGPAYYAASRLRYFLKLGKVRVTTKVAGHADDDDRDAHPGGPRLPHDRRADLDHEPSVGQLLRRDTAQAARCAGGHRRHDRQGHRRRAGGAPAARRQGQDGRRLRPLARRPRRTEPDRPPPDCGRGTSRGRGLPRLARGARRVGHAPAPHDAAPRRAAAVARRRARSSASPRSAATAQTPPATRSSSH